MSRVELMDTVVWTYMGSSGQLGVRKIVELVDTSRCGLHVNALPMPGVWPPLLWGA